ncbi:hypothetical protein CONPUDRAFT_160032 [Coniophora puteana RWD-64-598 SS2]|uniref:Arrestin-like N-terminal domain-containing protein n=1 Tax=Coniophora puteana (strain RWD-64-598) TaxID=741705 RepID=R7SGZ5_CONPW|nr:uncharacterized protein CONPUDRAFT_160032 [Coniophora puteana RWD-64-598 SS2]EIW74324.1 hypothetical protein CONPUDRAFT_160032 [Coniophora puteana RWD-64-598 SS2]
MFPKGFASLLAVAGLASQAATSVQPEPPSDCTFKAWVRAPDLAPNTIVTGDVRVKAARSYEVEAINVGLRYKERRFVKTVREGEVLPSHPGQGPRTKNLGAMPVSPWELPTHSEWFNPGEAHTEYLKAYLNQTLWDVSEEELVLFDIRHPVNLAQRPGVNFELFSKLEERFSILVPNTNFPPAPAFAERGFMSSQAKLGEMKYSEYVYDYFVEITTTNGSKVEVPAGITAFQPIIEASEGTPITETVNMKLRDGISDKSDDTNITYTVEITLPEGRTLTQGSTTNVTAVIHRMGPATGTSLEARVDLFMGAKGNEHNRVNRIQPAQDLRAQLRATAATAAEEPEDPSALPQYRFYPKPRGPFILPSATPEEIATGAIIRTSSVPITIPIAVNSRAMPDFETRWSTFGHRLGISLTIAEPNNDAPSPRRAGSPYMPFFVDDDDYEWTPWSTKPASDVPPTKRTSYTGITEVPVVVVPISPSDSAPIAGKASPSASAGQEQQIFNVGNTATDMPPPVWYLTPGARSPVFVDRSSVDDLLTKLPAERDALAPVIDAKLHSYPEDECLYVVDGATAPPSVPPAADPPPSVSYTLEVVLVSPVLAELDDAVELAADIDGEEDAESGEKARVQLSRRTKRLVGSTRTRDESRAW